MIEQIAIQNYQAHSKLRVDFAPGITCIVGPSDVGKSAIVRALRWVCINEPGGDAFIQHGAKGCTVKLVVDGHTVARRRAPGGDVNEYRLDDQEFKAFGRTVPEPIAKLLQLAPVCWQGQHDAPYWFMDTAGEVSRQLNAIVNLGVIDEVLAKVAQTRTRAKAKLEMAEDLLTNNKHEFDQLAWVDDCDNTLTHLEQLKYVAERGSTQAAQCRALVAEGRKYTTQHVKAATAALTGLKAAEIADRVTQLCAKALGIRSLLHQASFLGNAAGKVIPDMGELPDLYDIAKEQKTTSLGLRFLVAEAKRKKNDLCDAEIELQAATAALPKMCPLCSRSL